MVVAGWIGGGGEEKVGEERNRERREVIVEEKVGRREGGGEREGGEHMVFRTLRVIFKSHLEGGGGDLLGFPLIY